MMHALPLVCLCVLTRSGAASADGPGPEVIKVEQDGDVLLPCSNKQNMESGVFHWKKEKKEVFLYENGKHYNKDLDGQDEQFIGRVSYFQDQLKHGNASIIIRNTKMEDAGTYTCFFPPLQTPKTSIELVVGAAPKPFVASLHQTKDWSLLQCEAHGNPRPEVKWEDSSGNQLAADEPELSERGSSFYVKLNVTVKKTDLYRCVATQETINHQIYAETFEFINGGVQEPVVKTLDETKDWSLLQCVVRGASPELRVEWEDSSAKTLLAHKPTFPVRGGSYDIILNITVTQTDRYRCVATDKTNKRTEDETYVHISGWIGIVVGVVVAVLVTLLLGVGLLVVLVSKGYISLKSKKGSSGNEGETKDTEEDPLKNEHST